jgi:hypothetical protein
VKRHFTIFIFIICVGLFSCSSDSGKNKDNVPSAFRQLIRKFKPLKLPIQIREGEIIEMNLYDSKSSDTLFIPPCTFYGILPDTNNYYALIILLPADIMVPDIIIFDKKGEKISEKTLIVSGCGGGGPGLDCTPQTTIIKKDLTIYCVDTIKSVEIDRNGKPIDSTRKYYYVFKNGKINNDGKITMTGELTKDLK